MEALDLLRSGASLVLSVSGGKDSDAMTHYLLDLRKKEGWSGDVCFVHADLGRAEWHQTPAYVQSLADGYGFPLHITRYTHGDLIDRIWKRYYSDPSRPCWPSSAMRYCTSDLKRGPIDRTIRNLYPEDRVVVCAMGLRAEESTAREKKLPFTVRKDCTSERKSRYVYDWLPIHKWAEEDVWDTIDRLNAGVAHEAYALGNQRLSCAICILGSPGDILNGVNNNPDTYREYCRIEAVTGWSFKNNYWLSDLRPELLPAETLEAVAGHKRKAQSNDNL